MDAYQNQHNLPNHHPKVQGRLDGVFLLWALLHAKRVKQVKLKSLKHILPFKGKFLANPQFVNLFKLKPAYIIQG